MKVCQISTILTGNEIPEHDLYFASDNIPSVSMENYLCAYCAQQKLCAQSLKIV